MRRWILLYIPLSLLVPACSFAQTNHTESLTITTYYPSPYGVYRDLEIHRSLKYHPQADLNTVTDPTEGQLVYLNNTTSQGFYYYNGTSWQAQSGGSSGGTVVTFSCAWVSDYTNGTFAAGTGAFCGSTGSSCCTPQNCPSGELNADVLANHLPLSRL